MSMKLVWRIIAAIVFIIGALVLGGNYLAEQRSERTRQALIVTLEGRISPPPFEMWSDQWGFVAKCKNTPVTLRPNFSSLVFNKYDFSGTCGAGIVFEIDCKVTTISSCAVSETYEAHMRRMQEKIDREKSEQEKAANSLAK